jgi:hypothetical protein
MTDLNWRQRLLAEWPHDPQRHHRAQAAVKELDLALQTLMSMGFPLHIEEGPPPTIPLEWPKMVFHIRAGSKQVNCQADLEELGPDWYPSMEDARQAAGMAKQWQRGGIFSKSLPAPIGLVPDTPPAALPPETRTQSRRARLNGTQKANYPLPVVMPGTH